MNGTRKAKVARETKSNAAKNAENAANSLWAYLYYSQYDANGEKAASAWKRLKRNFAALSAIMEEAK